MTKTSTSSAIVTENQKWVGQIDSFSSVTSSTRQSSILIGSLVSGSILALVLLIIGCFLVIEF
jgi:type IV secretory pathway VirB6-like protein